MEHVTNNSINIKHSSNLFYVPCYVLHEHRQMSHVNCLKLKKAFTLLELLLVIAIIAVLAGIIIISLKPAEKLQQATQTKYLANANDVEKALNSYIVDNGGNLPSTLNSLVYGYYDICKTSATGCVSLSDLVPKYIPSLPIDTDNSTTDTTGFKLKYDPTKKDVSVNAYSEYRQWAEANGVTLFEGLVGYWKMNEASWNGTAGEVKDLSVNNNNGISINGTSITSSGKYGYGGSFDGIDDYLNMGTQVSNLTGDATVALWVKTSASGTLITNRDNNLNAGDWYSLNSTLLEIGNPYYGVVFTRNIRDNNWHHVLFTKKSSTFKIYIDGVLDVTRIQNSSINHINKNTFIGKHWTNPTGYNIAGTIDEVRIYSRELNSLEVKALYDYASSPVGHWKFDETLGTLASDSSGFGNSGNIINSPSWIAAKYGNGLSFNGSTNYINVPDVTGTISLDVSSGFTFDAWIKPTSASGCGIVNGPNCIIFNKEVSYEWALNSTNSIEWAIANSNPGWAWINTNVVAPNNVWSHVALVYDGSTVMTYLNGVLSHTRSASTGNLSVNDQDIKIAARGGDGAPSSFFPGQIDEVKIYNYARTQDQIIKDMNNQ